MTFSPPPTTSSSWPRRLTWALLVLALVLAVALAVTTRRSGPEAVVPTAVTPTGAPPQSAAAFTATDQNGESYLFDPVADGTVTALFFGFTHCPDTCPLTLAILQRTRQALAPTDRDALRVVLVSLDPERDTPARLRAYLAHFDPEFVGLRVERPALDAVTRAYGVASSKDASTGAVAHTSALYILGRDGQPRLMYAQAPAPERLARDLRGVLREQTSR